MAHATSTQRSGLAQAAVWLWRFISRVPVSLFLIAVITILALVNGSLNHHTDPVVIQRWGVSWDNLARGRFINLPISDLLVLSQAHYVSTLALMVCYTGVAEWLGGTPLAVLTFWPPSWIGTMVSVVLSKYLVTVTAWRPDPDLVRTADVGSSAGNWGSAGALIVLLYRIKPVLGWLAGSGFSIALVYRLAFHRSTADIAHAVALAVGFFICRAYLTRMERASATST